MRGVRQASAERIIVFARHRCLAAAHSQVFSARSSTTERRQDLPFSSAFRVIPRGCGATSFQPGRALDRVDWPVRKEGSSLRAQRHPAAATDSNHALSKTTLAQILIFCKQLRKKP